MKRIAVLILTITLSAPSCKKESEKKYCWKCITTVTMTPSSAGGTGSSTNTVCDQSQEDIDKYEKAGTQTTTSSSGGYTVTMKSVTNCVRQ
jgi:hypothetical protein